MKNIFWITPEEKTQYQTEKEREVEEYINDNINICKIYKQFDTTRITGNTKIDTIITKTKRRKEVN